MKILEKKKLLDMKKINDVKNTENIFVAFAKLFNIEEDKAQKFINDSYSSLVKYLPNDFHSLQPQVKIGYVMAFLYDVCPTTTIPHFYEP